MSESGLWRNDTGHQQHSSKSLDPHAARAYCFPMKITLLEDGWFSFHTRNGREIRGLYARYPHEKKPCFLTLVTFTEDPTGQPKFAGREIPVLGRLNHWELQREAEKIERSAEGIERGDPAPAHVEQFDLRNTPAWGSWLKKNPDFLKENPHYLKDLPTGEDPTH